MKTRKIACALALTVLGTSMGAAFAQADTAIKPVSPYVGKLASMAVCSDCGTVMAVEEHSGLGKSSGLGTVAGGVGGALLGKKIGDSNTGAVVGAVGGAVLGNYIERRMKKKTYFTTRVKMDDGTEREQRTDARPALGVEQRVRVSGDAFVAMKSTDAYYRATPTVLLNKTPASQPVAPSTPATSKTINTVAPSNSAAPAPSGGPKLKDN